MSWKADGASLGAAQTLLDSLEASLQTLVNWPDVDTSKLAPLIRKLRNKATDGAALSAALQQFFAGYAIAVAASFQSVDETMTSRGALPVADLTYGLGAFAAYGGDLPPAMGARAVKNQKALVALVQSLAVMALAKLYARTNFAAQDDADAARDLITGFVETLAQAASDSSNSAMYLKWNALYQKTSADLTARGLRLPGTLEVVLNAAMPALNLAQRFYGDARRAGELVSRNYAAHPLFLPAVLETLTR